MKKIFLLLILSLVANSICLAQKAETVSGSFRYLVDERSAMTFAEARIKAIENARTEALKQAFGSTVSSDIVSETFVGPDGTAYSELREITQETARGEWLGDSSEPELDIKYDGDTHSFIYDVKISGKARRITKAKTSLDWKILCEGTDDSAESDTFNSGEHIYVSFKSPVSGYLAIYLMGDSGSVNCLLPYMNDEDGIFKVRGGQNYILFDRERDNSAVRYRLKTGRSVENNVVYLLFSTNPFTKCLDNSSDPSHPNSLSVSEFEKWRAGIMQHDDNMISEKKWVKIKNNQ